MASSLPTAELCDQSLHFFEPGGFDRARAAGAFHLRHPQSLDFRAGVEFACKYYLPRTDGADEAYCGFRTRALAKSLLGHSRSGVDQDEILQIEAQLWEEYLPAEVARLLSQINALTRSVLTDLLLRAGVRQHDVNTVASGLSDNQALQYCIFNHYSSLIDRPVGLTAHKDSGFITTLYTTEAGLESKEGDAWVPFDPLPGHFTVVLGHSLEILTCNLPKPVAASYHRVRRMPPRPARVPDRFTFGVYIRPRWDQPLYQYDCEGKLGTNGTFLDFQRAKAMEMGYEFHPRITSTIV